MIRKIHWFGNSSFLINTTPVIYINPWRIANPPLPADIILIGHHKHEYFSPPDIAKLRTPNTRIITTEEVAKELPSAEILRPFQTISLGRASVKGIPATVDDGLGFVISVNFFDIYYAGDTTGIPTIEALHPDIVILPVDGSGTTTAQSAADMIKRLRPRWAIPCKWNAASRINATQFQQEAGASSEVVLMQPAT